MISLTHYADLVHLDLADALHEAAVCGLTINLHSDPVSPGREDVTEDEALVVGAEDPALVYLTGADEQTGETAAAMAERAS